MAAGFRPSSSGLERSIFTSLAPLADNNTKANRAALESHLASGSATALLNAQLEADALAARQRTADWAAQRRKAGTETALSEVQRGKRRRLDQGYDQDAREPIEVPEVERPDGFPSNDMLASLHSHAAARFAAQHLLLPPLTSANPSLPPDALARIGAVKAELDALDEQAAHSSARRGGVKRWRDVKSGWHKVKDRGDRRDAWKDLERKLEPSALVALGILVRIMAEDALFDPNARPDPPPGDSTNARSADEHREPAFRTSQSRLAAERMWNTKAEKARKKEERLGKMRRSRLRRLLDDDEGDLTTWSSDAGMTGTSPSVGSSDADDATEILEGGDAVVEEAIPSEPGTPTPGLVAAAEHEGV